MTVFNRRSTTYDICPPVAVPTTSGGPATSHEVIIYESEEGLVMHFMSGFKVVAVFSFGWGDSVIDAPIPVVDAIRHHNAATGKVQS